MNWLRERATAAGVTAKLQGSRGLKLGLAVGLVVCGVQVQAAPYASNVGISGTTVNFILNEPADTLTYSINGGAAVALDGTTKGMKSFTLGSPTDTFSIVAQKNDPLGYTIPTGGTIPGGGTQAPVDTAEGGFNVISDEESALTRFNSPRGVDVSNNPNAPNFGTVYITNSALGTVPDPVNRTLGDGLYALRADGSDAYGNGDTAANPTVEGFPAWVASANSPLRVSVGEDGFAYVDDYTDTSGSLIRISPDISPGNIIGTNVLASFGGTPPLPTGQNHGSIVASHVVGTPAEGNVTIYTIDEDLTTAHVTGSGAADDFNGLWRYDVGAGSFPTSVTPTKISGEIIPVVGVLADLDRGADGKLYNSQYRFDGNEAGLFVLDETGATLWDSLTASGSLGATQDLMRLTRSVSVSEDQQWLAAMLAYSDVLVVPLVDGIPDLANRLVVNTGDDISLGRDIAFDAANNIHYVSSGQARYRVLSPGGETTTTLSWNGTEFDFTLDAGGGPGEGDADFDGDGDVDGADFLTWQRNLGTSGTQAQGNADGQGAIDAADLAVWKQQFSAGGGPVAAVPEPTTWGLAALAALACLLTSLPRRRLAVAKAKS